MRVLSLLLGLWLSASAWAEDIAQVLERSQQTRLQARLAAASTPAAERVRASFSRLVALAPPSAPVVELQVMQGGIEAEAMLGRVLMVGEAVGDLPEGERLMLLAHEYAHLQLGHWQALVAMYQRHIPGEVRPDTTQPVAQILAREGRELSHQQELEADAYGYRLVQPLQVDLEQAVSLLMRRPMASDTPTHPSTRRRMAALRALPPREEAPPRQAAALGF